ncbi:MAG: high-affinity nickel-transport family protein [Gemmatimonadota bacterium]
MLANLLPTLLLGVVLGMRHATDADHVVAVTTITAGRRRIGDAMRIGALWGVGHTLTILLVGGAIIALHLIIPPRLGLAMEFAVALMLIGLGAYNLLGGRRLAMGAMASLRPVLVGIVHGLAGSAAVALLVLATIPEPRWAAGYLLLFGLGTILGMMAITASIAAPLSMTLSRFARVQRSLQLAAGTLSVAFGLFLASHIALADGLFASAPQWTPR